MTYKSQVSMTDASLVSIVAPANRSELLALTEEELYLGGIKFKMRTDALKQYASLRDKLFAEKTKIEARLLAINRVLGQETEQPKGRPVRSARDSATASDLGSGKLTMKEAILKALSKGPMTRKELGKAVEDLGYVSKSKNLLNSMGVFLYSKNSPVKKQGKMFLLPKGAVKESLPKKKRQMSPAARAKIAAAQKARWARQRKAA